MNSDHPEAVDEIAALHLQSEEAGWRIVTSDRRGFELARGDRLERVEFDAPVTRPDGFRAAYVALLSAEQHD